jgi:hypothetical protein
VKRAALAFVLVACAKEPQAQPQTQATSEPSASVVAAASSSSAPATIDKSTSCKEGELTDGTLGVFTAEHHSMEVRKRHEDAAATVPGWKGDVT